MPLPLYTFPWGVRYYLSVFPQRASLVTQEMRVCSLIQEDPLEEEMATQSSILSWKSPWTEDVGGLQSIGSQSWIQLSNWTTTIPTESWFCFCILFHSLCTISLSLSLLYYEVLRSQPTFCWSVCSQSLMLAFKDLVKDWVTWHTNPGLSLGLIHLGNPWLGGDKDTMSLCNGKDKTLQPFSLANKEFISFFGRNYIFLFGEYCRIPSSWMMEYLFHKYFTNIITLCFWVF